MSIADLKMWNASRFCVSSLRRGHANLLCIVPILVYVLPKQAHQICNFFKFIQNFGWRFHQCVYIHTCIVYTCMYSVYVDMFLLLGVKLARIKPLMWSEEKAKVVAAVWGAEFLKFFAALAISYQDNLTRLICTRMS